MTGYVTSFCPATCEGDNRWVCSDSQGFTHCKLKKPVLSTLVELNRTGDRERGLSNISNTLLASAGVVKPRSRVFEQSRGWAAAVRQSGGEVGLIFIFIDLNILNKANTELGQSQSFYQEAHYLCIFNVRGWIVRDFKRVRDWTCTCLVWGSNLSTISQERKAPSNQQIWTHSTCEVTVLSNPHIIKPNNHLFIPFPYGFSYLSVHHRETNETNSHVYSPWGISYIDASLTLFCWVTACTGGV